MKKTASLLVVLAALFTMSSTFSAEAPKFGADRHVAHGMACASCHGPDGKSPEYPDQETCLKCHQKDAPEFYRRITDNFKRAFESQGFSSFLIFSLLW